MSTAAVQGNAPVTPWTTGEGLALRPQTLTSLALAVAAFLVAALLSPFFADAEALLDATPRYAEIGLLALAMTIVVVNADIDLSVASAMALCAAVLARLADAGVAVGAAAAAAVMLGAMLGLANGIVITRFGLPSVVVTLATLALYRGVAEVLLTDRAIAGYPGGFTDLSVAELPGTPIPLPLVVFLACAVGFGLLLHRTLYGRYCFVVGSNADVARYSGLRVSRVRLVAFALSGLMAGLAAVLITSRLGSTRSDLGLGFELAAITVVVLGGTSIFGGKGSIAATVLALAAVMFLREGMTLANVGGQTQDAVIGGLLILSILVPLLVAAALRRGRRT